MHEANTEPPGARIMPSSTHGYPCRVPNKVANLGYTSPIAIPFATPTGRRDLAGHGHQGAANARHAGRGHRGPLHGAPAHDAAQGSCLGISCFPVQPSFKAVGSSASFFGQVCEAFRGFLVVYCLLELPDFRCHANCRVTGENNRFMYNLFAIHMKSLSQGCEPEDC